MSSGGSGSDESTLSVPGERTRRSLMAAVEPATNDAAPPNGFGLRRRTAAAGREPAWRERAACRRRVLGTRGAWRIGHAPTASKVSSEPWRATTSRSQDRRPPRERSSRRPLRSSTRTSGVTSRAGVPGDCGGHRSRTTRGRVDHDSASYPRPDQPSRAARDAFVAAGLYASARLALLPAPLLIRGAIVFELLAVFSVAVAETGGR